MIDSLKSLLKEKDLLKNVPFGIRLMFRNSLQPPAILRLFK